MLLAGLQAVAASVCLTPQLAERVTGQAPRREPRTKGATNRASQSS